MKRLSLEIFSEGIIGSSFGVIGSIFFNQNDLLIILIGGVSGIIGRILIPKVFDFIELKYSEVKDSKAKFTFPLFKKVVLATCLVVGICGVVFCVYSPKRYGDKLVASSVLKIKSHPGLGGNQVALLKKGEKVEYLDRMWRKYRFVEDGKNYFDFWVKVETSNGKVGWTYGAYLD